MRTTTGRHRQQSVGYEPQWQRGEQPVVERQTAPQIAGVLVVADGAMTG